ncbi:MAG: pyridoxine 5'-phosphate synthase [Pseudomonadales bacterium]|jgi:pyridoxine 5-phosphate synthase
MTVLSVNVNKIALLRNSRLGNTPSVLGAARIAIAAGARGITVHPRPDQRHIRPNDVTELAAMLRSDYPGIEFNIEGNPFAGARDNGYPGFDTMIEQTRPDQVTLVPDSDQQLTSDHGWNLGGDLAPLAERIRRYHLLGARVSLFMDPEPEMIDRAPSVNADRIELYTGPFAATVSRWGLDDPRSLAVLDTYRVAARHARTLGLGVNAGHDLDRLNLQLFQRIPDIDEVSIGHALVADALELGLDATVRAYCALLTPA